MTAVAVADAWAVLAFARGEEPAAGVMRRLLRRARSGNLRLVINVINLGEVYYRMAQVAGDEKAQEWMDLLRALPLDTIQAREPLVMDAARLKARYRLGYADAFAVATARLERGPVITGDADIIALPKGVVRVRSLVRNERARGDSRS